MSRNELYGYTIYQNPSDYPGKFVVRRWACLGGPVIPDTDPLAVVDSLEEARNKIPRDFVMFRRDPADDPVIVETWI